MRAFDRPAIAVLVQQARRGRQHGAGAVEVHGAAFHDDARVEHRQLQLFGDPRRHRVVGIPGRILAAPRVEAPVDDGGVGLAAPGAQHERRTMIARPGFVGGNVVKEHAAQRHLARLEELANDALVVFVGDVEVDLLALRRGRGSGRRYLQSPHGTGPGKEMPSGRGQEIHVASMRIPLRRKARIRAAAGRSCL